jgi:hypothetical protein
VLVEKSKMMFSVGKQDNRAATIPIWNYGQDRVAFMAVIANPD